MIFTEAGSGMTRTLRPMGDILERLAAAMDTTSEAFFVDDVSADASMPASVVAAQESADLMKAFSTVTDPEERQRCLAYVRAAAATSKRV